MVKTAIGASFYEGLAKRPRGAGDQNRSGSRRRCRAMVAPVAPTRNAGPGDWVNRSPRSMPPAEAVQHRMVEVPIRRQFGGRLGQHSFPRPRASDIPNAGFVTPIDAGEQAAPVDRAENRPERYGDDVDILAAQHRCGPPDFDQPTQLLLARAG